jgi:hypothetical protein
MSVCSRGQRASFVVRAVQDGRGQVSGVIERVATGAKEAFTGMAAIGRVIVRMLQGESASRTALTPRQGVARKRGSERAPGGGSVEKEATD